MPHIVIEYSANLDGRFDIPRLLKRLRDTVLADGVFALEGVRARAYRADHYLIADAHPENAFVHLTLRVGHGRDVGTRERAGQALFNALCHELAALQLLAPLSLSLEVQEIDPVLTFKKNNLREYVERRAG